MAVKSNKQAAAEDTAEQVEESSQEAEGPTVEIPNHLSVKQLADILETTAVDVIKQLMRNSIMANINQIIDFEAASAVAEGLGYVAKLQAQTGRRETSLIKDIKNRQLEQGREDHNLKTRPPIVTVMGHVNHGKTRLLDTIRKTNVMDQEAGSITQHIGAYQVEIDGKKITFLDTPGHEAFTAMRARGAQVTDITILIVAADDGIMPQTREAIDHAQAAGVPIIVAINKIDKPESNPDNVKQQLTDAGLLIEEWGGETICVLISARENMGIPELLENILLVAEMEELKADPAKPAEGIVIEAELDKTRGALTTVLIHNGTLRVGDTIVVGDTWGRIRAMFNDSGKQVRRAGPAMPVKLLGLSSVSQAGDTVNAVAGERQAKDLIAKHQPSGQLASSTGQKAVNLSNLLDQVSAGEVKELSVILKTDVQGSIDPIRSSLEPLSTEEVQVSIIHSGTGNVTESDVMLAVASKGIIIGFNTASETGAQRMAEKEGISIRQYDVTYNLVDDVSKALKGMLAPTEVEVIDGHAEVRQVFSSGKTLKIAGSYVTDGKVTRGVSVRVTRAGEVIADSIVSTLRRFKDDAREVATGYECGISLRDYNKLEEGDILEFYRMEETF